MRDIVYSAKCAFTNLHWTLCYTNIYTGVSKEKAIKAIQDYPADLLENDSEYFVLNMYVDGIINVDYEDIFELDSRMKL